MPRGLVFADAAKGAGVANVSKGRASPGEAGLDLPGAQGRRVEPDRGVGAPVVCSRVGESNFGLAPFARDDRHGPTPAAVLVAGVGGVHLRGDHESRAHSALVVLRARPRGGGGDDRPERGAVRSERRCCGCRWRCVRPVAFARGRRVGGRVRGLREHVVKASEGLGVVDGGECRGEHGVDAAGFCAVRPAGVLCGPESGVDSQRLMGGGPPANELNVLVRAPRSAEGAGQPDAQ